MERANQSQTTTAQSATNAPPQATSAAGIVQAIIASGKREPSEIAEIVKAHPTIAKDIIQVLQMTMGNAFVQNVLRYAGASIAPEAKPADNAAPAAPKAPVATAPPTTAPTTPTPAPAPTTPTPTPATATPVAAATAIPGAAPTPNENAPMPLGPVRVTASLLNVRRTASTAKSDNIVGELQHGAVVTTTAQHGDWFQIDYEGQPAFVFSHYITPADAKAAAVSTTANAHAPAAAIAHAGTAPAAPVAPAPVANAGTDHEKHTAPAAEKQPEKAADGTTAKPAANANANAAPAAGVATAQQGKPGEPTTVGNGKESKALKHGKGYVRYGGGTVKNALVQLVQAGKLKLTGAQIAQLDAIAQVETGGQIGCVQTYDNQVVSMGFKQVVLGYGSLEKVMTKAPAGFAKYGLSLDTSAQYTDVTGGHPSKIAGAPDSAALRTQEWGDKFFHASMESDVIAALCDLVLADAKKVDTAIQKDAGGIANFDDPTARAWLLEMYNNRPAYVPYAVRRAAEAGAASAANRNEFLDILANSIVKVYEELEPEFAYRSKVKKHPEYTDEQRTALKHELDAELGPGAAQKGKNIVTKISRNLEIPKVNESETVKQSTPAATPPTTAVVDQHLQQPLPQTHEDAKSSPPPAQAEANKAAEHPQAPKPKKPADQPAAPATTATATVTTPAPVVATKTTVPAPAVATSPTAATSPTPAPAVATSPTPAVATSPTPAPAVATSPTPAPAIATSPTPAPAIATSPTPAPVAAAPTTPAPVVATPSTTTPAHAATVPSTPAKTETKTPTPDEKKKLDNPAAAQHNDHPDPHAMLDREAAQIVQAYKSGSVSYEAAIEQYVAFDKKCNGGEQSDYGAKEAIVLGTVLAGFAVAKQTQKDPVVGMFTSGSSATANVGAHVPALSSSADGSAIGTDDHASRGGPAGTWTPPPGAQLDDASITQLAAQVGDPRTTQIVTDLAGVMAVAARMKPHLYNGVEAAGTDREQLVAGIRVVREGILALPGGTPHAEAFKVAVNHKLESLSPYYAQQNIQTLETGSYTECNLTSLAMSLSTIGKNADSYSRNKHAHVIAVARHFVKDLGGERVHGENAGRDVSSSDEKAWATLRGLRLADFLTYAAIATSMTSPTDDIKTAAGIAVSQKDQLPFLERVAHDFGANTYSENFPLEGGERTNRVLQRFADSHNHLSTDPKNHIEDVDDLVDARRAAEASPHNEKLQANYARLRAKFEGVINGGDIEAKVPLETYKHTAMTKVKPLIDAGAGVIVGCNGAGEGHYTHLFGIDDQFIYVQDPGLWGRAERKIMWDEARALGYFWNYLVVR